MSIETSLVLIKPDGVKRGLCGEILTRFERTGLKIAGIKLMTLTRETADSHYGEHRNRHYFESLLDYITSGPVLAVALTGPNAIAVVRKIMGATDPGEASMGTIRGDLALHVDRNLIHGSEHEFDAKKEIERFFTPEDIESWGDGEAAA